MSKHLRDKLETKLIRKNGEQEIEIRQFVGDARAREQWIVAWDQGRFELQIGQHKMSLDSVEPGEIKRILSHRWKPALPATSTGAVPLPMLTSSYPEPTWVDFLNHFNFQQYTAHVLENMGRLYLENECRALYFEGELRFEEMAEACSRCWMWQELSLGPQRHDYASAEAVWLHFVVRLGDLYRVFDIAASLWDPVQKRAANILDALAANSLHSAGTTAEMRAAMENGSAGAVLAAVMSVPHRGWIPGRGMAEVLGRSMGSGWHLSKALREASKRLRSFHVLMIKCAAAVYSNRDVRDERVAHLVRTYSGMSLLAQLAGVGELGVETHVAAMEALLSAAGSGGLTSAVCNVANKNVSVAEDRLVASFGVLCAQRGVECSAARVNGMLARARDVHVSCMWAEDSMGLGAATRRRVEVEQEGKEGVSGVGAVLSSVGILSMTGNWRSRVVCQAVSLSGMALGRCEVVTDAGAFGGRARAGVLLNYELRGGRLLQCQLLKDNGTLLQVLGCTDPASGERAPLPVAAPDFIAWLETLEPARARQRSR